MIKTFNQFVNEAAQAAMTVSRADGSLTSDDLKIIQQILADRGYLKKTFGTPPQTSIDGKLGEMTKAAIKKFREVNRISGEPEPFVDKVKGLTVGPQTLARINSVSSYSSQKPLANVEDVQNPMYGQSTWKNYTWPSSEADLAEVEALSAKIVDLFKNSSFWTEFKDIGGIDDNEVGAQEKYVKWFNQNVKPALDKMGEKNGNARTILWAHKQIANKILGGQTSDSVQWSLYYVGPTGSIVRAKNYDADTDF